MEWLRRNKLSLNESKTEVIIFHHQNENIDSISIKLNKIKLKIVKNVKCLGVNIDETLSWNKKIKDVKLKISKANGIACLTKSVYQFIIRYFTATSVKVVWHGPLPQKLT